MPDKIDAEIERLALPGHDREVARAIHNQARIRSSPIDAIQVAHLLAIGYAAGVAEGRRRAADAIRERAEAAKTVDLTGPRAVRYRTLLAAARMAGGPPTLDEVAEALAAGNAVVCRLDEAGRSIPTAEGAPAEPVEEDTVAEPTQPFTDADVQVVARAIAPDLPEAETDFNYREDAVRVLSALAAAGPDVWQYAMPDPDEPDGLMPLDGTPRHISPKWLRRPLRAVGPWLPVPTEEATDG